ncbi:MAG: RNA methyltransferase [Actinomycetota bacterium]
MEPLSPRNPRVQEVRRLARQGRHRADRRAFVVEGQVLVLEAARAGLIQEAYAAPAVDAAWLDEMADLGTAVTFASDAAIEAMATTVTPQPVVAVAAMPAEFALHELGAGHVVVLDAVGDPGNAGTILRSAEASGAACVVVGPGSVDPFGPKVVRASAGAVFRVPVSRVDDLRDALEVLRSTGRRSYGTAVDAGAVYDEVDLTEATIVMGSEAHGMSDDVRAEVDAVVRIPQAGAGESLNVAMAATVLGFEAARQRRASTAGQTGADTLREFS